MKQKLLNLISEGKTNQAIQLLLEITKGTDRHNGVVIQSARYKDYEKSKNLGISSFDEQKISLGKVNMALVSLVENLDINGGEHFGLSKESKPNETVEVTKVIEKTSKKKTKKDLWKTIGYIALIIGIFGGIAKISGYSLRDIPTSSPQQNDEKGAIKIPNSKNLNLGSIETNTGNVQIGDNYYLKSTEYIDLLERIDELEALVNVTEDKTKKLRYSEKLNNQIKQKETFEKEVIKLAETFNKIEINTERLKQAKQFFEDRKFKEARTILDTEAIQNDQEKFLKRKQDILREEKENKKALRNNADEFHIKAKLTEIDYRLENRFEKTDLYYEKSLLSDRNEDNLLDYAHFLMHHNQLVKSISLLNDVIDIYINFPETKSQTYFSDLAVAYGIKGIAQTRTGNFIEAKESLEKAIENQRKLIFLDSLKYWSGLVNNLNNLGNVFCHLKEYEQAKKLYLEVTDFRRKLVLSDKKHLPNLATDLNNLGISETYLGEFDLAKGSYIEAFEIQINILEQCPDSQLIDMTADISKTVSNLGVLYEKNNEFEKAKQLHFKALDNRKLLVEISSFNYLPDLAETQLNLGLFYLKSEINKDKSIKYTYEAICSLSSFQDNPYFQKYVKIAVEIFEEWDVDVENYLKKNKCP